MIGDDPRRRPKSPGRRRRARVQRRQRQLAPAAPQPRWDLLQFRPDGVGGVRRLGGRRGFVHEQKTSPAGKRIRVAQGAKPVAAGAAESHVTPSRAPPVVRGLGTSRTTLFLRWLESVCAFGPRPRRPRRGVSGIVRQRPARSSSRVVPCRSRARRAARRGFDAAGAGGRRREHREDERQSHARETRAGVRPRGDARHALWERLGTRGWRRAAECRSRRTKTRLQPEQKDIFSFGLSPVREERTGSRRRRPDWRPHRGARVARVSGGSSPGRALLGEATDPVYSPHL